VRKTSVYLTEAETARLARLAEREGVSQAEVIRRAITAYVPRTTADRGFRLAGVADGPGDSVADHDEDELLAGFGE
jgi:predicted transcriptional regulator